MAIFAYNTNILVNTVLKTYFNIIFLIVYFNNFEHAPPYVDLCPYTVL